MARILAENDKVVKIDNESPDLMDRDQLIALVNEMGLALHRVNDIACKSGTIYAYSPEYFDVRYLCCYFKTTKEYKTKPE